jgi:hypothetical protein
MNDLSAIVDGAIALFGMFGGLAVFVWAVKAGEETATAGSVTSGEARAAARKAA